MATRSTKKQKVADETTEQALAASVSAEELQARINARAQEVFLARNGGPGDELSDWLTAEREVCASLLKIAPVTNEAIPMTTTAPKRKRATTAKPKANGSTSKSSANKSISASTKLSGKTPSSAPRSRKRKTVDE